MRTVDLCLEAPKAREIWATLTIPDPASPSASQVEDKPAIVMAHGFLGFKDWAFFPWLSSFFAEAGFPVVRFNFSGSGMGPQVDGPFTEPDAFQEDSITRQVEDLNSVLHCLIHGKLEPDLPAQKNILLWGHSRGGAVSLLAAARSPAVKGVATWATISRINRYLYEVKQDWRKRGFLEFESFRTKQTLRYSTTFLEDAEKWGKEGDVPIYLHNLNVPVLLVHGSEDTSVPPEESESLAAVHPQSQLAILSGANHKFNSDHPFTQPTQVLQEAAQRTLDFFKNSGEDR